MLLGKPQVYFFDAKYQPKHPVEHGPPAGQDDEQIDSIVEDNIDADVSNGPPSCVPQLTIHVSTSEPISQEFTSSSMELGTSAKGSVDTLFEPPNRMAMQQQQDFFIWRQDSGALLSELGERMTHVNWRRVKYPRYLDYRLDAIWPELIADTSYTYRDWQTEAWRKPLQNWMKEYPPDIDVYGFRCERSRRHKRGPDLPSNPSMSARGSIVPSRRGSGVGSVDKRTSGLSGSNLLIPNVPRLVPESSDEQSSKSEDTVPPMRAGATPTGNIGNVMAKGNHRGSRPSVVATARSQTTEEIRVQNPSLDHNSIHHGMYGKNDLAYHMESLQYPRFCEAQHINYADLYELIAKLGESKFATTDDRLKSPNAKFEQVNGMNSSSATHRPIRMRLVFEVSLQQSKDQMPPIPDLRLARLVTSSARSTRGSKMPKSRANCLLREAMAVVCPDRTIRDILVGLFVAAGLEKLAAQFPAVTTCRLPKMTKMGLSGPTQISLNELVRLIDMFRKRIATDGEEPSKVRDRLPSWLSYTCDGTLTIRYPTGHPAIIWTPAPFSLPPKPQDLPTPAPVDSNTLELPNGAKRRPERISSAASPPPADKLSSKGRGNQRKKTRAVQSNIPAVSGRPEWGPIVPVTKQTGFYLFLFDLPPDMDSHKHSPTSNDTTNSLHKASNPTHSTQEAGGSHNSSINNVGSATNSPPCQSTLQPTFLQTLPTPSSSVSSESRPTGFAGNLNTEEEKKPNRGPNIGQLLAYLTPEGQGTVFHRRLVPRPDNRTSQISPHCGMHAVFTTDSCYMFQPSGNLQHNFPCHVDRDDVSSFRLPSSVDVQLNEYIRVYCSNPHDVMVTFQLPNRVDLIIQGHPSSGSRGTRMTGHEEMRGEEQAEPEEVEETFEGPKKLLSKLPFLSVQNDSSSSKTSFMYKKRREEALQRISKGTLEGDEYLKRYLNRTKYEIMRITEDWLAYLQNEIAVTHFRSSPRSPVTQPNSALVRADRARVTFRKVGNTLRFLNQLRSRTLSPKRSNPKGGKRTPRVIQSARMSKTRIKFDVKPESILRTFDRRDSSHSKQRSAVTLDADVGDQALKAVEEDVVQEKHNLDRMNREDTLNSMSSDTPSTERGDQEKICPIIESKELIESESNSTVISLADLPIPSPNPNRLQGLPADCPALLRAWLTELYSRKPGLMTQSNQLKDCIHDPSHQTAGERSQEFLHGVVQYLADIDFASLKVASRGCRCSRNEVSELTDFEMDLFLNHVVPPNQAIVVIVFDSCDSKSRQTDLFHLAQRWHSQQHHHIPSVVRSRSQKRTATAVQTGRSAPKENRVFSASSHAVPISGVGGMGACAALTTKLAQYRFVSYDLAQAAYSTVLANQRRDSSVTTPRGRLSHEVESLLRHRHGCRPRVGECLIFIQGQLCFVGASFVGYPGTYPTRKQLEDKILQCRIGLLRQDQFALPFDFQLT